AFAGLFYLSLWMAGKMHVFDRRGYSIKGVILVIPIMGALLVAISRVRDYRHSAVDVTWGSIIGTIFAVFAYFQYYPSLTKVTSHVPYPPRDFSKLVKDEGGHVHEAGHIEQFTGIERNEEFVDESRRSPLPLTANGVGTEESKDREDPLQRV
ncbi:phosphatidic acid phosphatase type, partial [Podila horticola]